MDEKESKPPITTVTRKFVGEDEQEKPPSAIIRAVIIVVTLTISTPTMLMIGHALPLLDSFFKGMSPLVGYMGFAVGIAFIVLVGLSVWYVFARFRVDIKRRIIEACKFQVDPLSGNYDAYFDESKRFLVPNPGVTVTPVPQTFAPQLHFINKGTVGKSDEKTIPALLEQGNIEKPSVEELARKVERNSLTLCLGRSLTTGKDLTTELNGTHLKIIGGTQMGKSCMAGSILAQIEKTHDPDVLCFALLDMEYKTSRLFEKSSHLARVTTGQGREVKLHAKTIEEVPIHLHYIVEELERRNRLGSYQDVEKLPHILIYIEEFLDLKKRLKSQGGKVCNQFLADFSTIATRGLKLGLHIMACAQVDYADDDLKDAMNQFIGLNLAFGVRPQAAMAAGFINSDLLSQNFASKTRGQFVLETLGYADLGIAPDYDVKEKIKALHQTRVLARETKDLSLETGFQVDFNQIENQFQTSSQAILADLDGEQWPIEQFNWKLDQMIALLTAKQNEQFKQIWEVSPGPGREYKRAQAEREALMQYIKSLIGKVA